jgi:hypothetical protein
MERMSNIPGKNSSGTNGLISFSGESTEKPAKTKYCSKYMEDI